MAPNQQPYRLERHIAKAFDGCGMVPPFQLNNVRAAYQFIDIESTGRHDNLTALMAHQIHKLKFLGPFEARYDVPHRYPCGTSLHYQAGKRLADAAS